MLRQSLKILQIISLTIVFSFALYSYHQQLVGDPEVRAECWKQGGVLWHNLDQSMICFKIKR